MNPTEMGIWMDQKEIDMVIKYLDKNSESIMLEYGCGGSTLLFSKYVNKYISIEHNLDWYIEVQDSIKSNNLNHIDSYLIDVPKEVPTSKKRFYDKWSTEIHKLSKEGLNTIPDLEYCIDPKNRYVWADYIDAVDEIGIEKYDFVFIDGRARADCAFKVLNYIDNNSVVFIHDFWPRKQYHGVLNYYDVIDKVDDTTQTLVALRKKNEEN